MGFEHLATSLIGVNRHRIAQLYQRLKKLSASMELKQLQNSLKSSLSCQALATLHPQQRKASNFDWSASCQLTGFFTQTYLVPLSRSFPWACTWRFSTRRT